MERDLKTSLTLFACGFCKVFICPCFVLECPVACRAQLLGHSHFQQRTRGQKWRPASLTQRANSTQVFMFLCVVNSAAYVGLALLK